MKKLSQLNRQLLRAVKTNSCDLIDPLLRQGADPLANDCRALVVAIEWGRVSILEKFVRHGIDINQHHINPLQIAIRCNQLETLAFLLNASLNLPGHLEVACLMAIRNDYGQAMAMLLAEDVEFNFSPVQECIENDSIICFVFLLGQGLNPQIQAAQIIEKCLEHSANKVLTFMLQNFPPGTQVLNSLLVRVTCECSIDLLEILINHGATGPDESTEAFIEAIKKSSLIPAAELLLPHINIARIDDQDLSNLACCCEYDLVKQLLRRGMPRLAYELTPMFACDFVPRIAPEDFFVFEGVFPLTKSRLEERLGFCGDLAKAAAIYAKHYGEDKVNEKIKIAIWLQRCMEIKTGMDNLALPTRRLRPA